MKILNELSELIKSIETIKSNLIRAEEFKFSVFQSHWESTGKPEMMNLTDDNSEKLRLLKLKYAKDVLKILEAQKKLLSAEIKRSL